MLKNCKEPVLSLVYFIEDQLFMPKFNSKVFNWNKYIYILEVPVV